MNNQCVPDFGVPTNSALPNQSGGNEIEQFWRNIHMLDRNSYTKPPSSNSVDTTLPPPPPPLPPAAANNQLDMTDEEMAAWLHYPLDNFFTEPSQPNPTFASPPPTTVRPTENSATMGLGHGFPLISRIVGPLERLRSGFTVVDSSDTPITSADMATVGSIEAAPAAASGVTDSTTAAVVGGGGDRVKAGEEVTTSPSNSSATATTTGTANTTGAICHKRKIEEIDESFAVTTAAAAPARIEDVDSDEEKKHSRGSSATKRTRSADVHNQSERKRRDRINERMKTLQSLIPHCNKSDKASMLDEAIEYTKSLQTQVQMMAMGYGMMYAGMQQQFAPLMGTGMGMGMGMRGPVMPPMQYSPAIPVPAAAAVPSPSTNTMLPLAPRLPIPPYALPYVQPSTAADSTGIQYAIQIPGMTQITNSANLHQQYLSYQQMQMQAVQSPTVNQPVLCKPISRKSEGKDEEDIQ